MADDAPFSDDGMPPLPPGVAWEDDPRFRLYAPPAGSNRRPWASTAREALSQPDAVSRALTGLPGMLEASEGPIADFNERARSNLEADARSWGVRQPEALSTAMAFLTGGVRGGAARAPKIEAPAVHTPPEVVGTKDLTLGVQRPATVGGRPPAQWSAEDMERFGAHYGQEGLGSESQPVSVPLKSGRVAQVPSAFLASGARPSYWDSLVLKAQGINPADLPEGMHGQIHDAMVRAVSPEGPSPPLHTFNNLVFGLTSPNQALTPNQMAMIRAMAKSPADIDKLANMTPWSLPQSAGIKGGSGSYRIEAGSPNITNQLGLQANPGLGASGSQDWTRLSDAAKMFQKNPDFFQFSGEHTPENWGAHVMKIGSQVPGLSIKTGSLGSVFQAPGEAQISAMDRHMAGKLRNELFDNPKEQADWEKMVVGKFNDAYGLKGSSKVGSLDDMLAKPGGTGIFTDQALAFLQHHPKALYRTRSGEINPRVPESMRGADWPLEPREVTMISPAYQRALAANARSAAEGGRSIFSQQWNIWDAIRQRIEPHENMNPALANIGRMNTSQLKDAWRAHVRQGFTESPGEVKPGARPGELAMFSYGGTPGLSVGSPFGEDEEDGWR